MRDYPTVREAQESVTPQVPHIRETALVDYPAIREVPPGPRAGLPHERGTGPARSPTIREARGTPNRDTSHTRETTTGGPDIIGRTATGPQGPTRFAPTPGRSSPSPLKSGPKALLFLADGGLMDRLAKESSCPRGDAATA